MIEEPFDLLEELSAIKVLAFMEIGPLTDTFQQIALTESQAFEIRKALFHIIAGRNNSQDDINGVDIITNDEVEVVLPEVREFYGDTFFKD